MSSRFEVAFSALSPEEKERVRETQRKRKLAKLGAKQSQQQRAEQKPPEPEEAGLPGLPTRTTVTASEYFEACPGGRFRDPNFPPTPESVELLLRILDAGDEVDEGLRVLSTCSYFQFVGRGVWDATFNARLAWEGFFTITDRGGREPLPELQPFYGVLLWENFEASHHVKRTLARLERERRGYVLSDRARPERTWQMIEEYHAERHSSNWLTRRYFEMLREASEDPQLNFQMHCIELSLADGASDGVTEGCPVRIEGLAGRIDLNGRIGTAVRHHADAGRWEVLCDPRGPADGEAVRVRPANLNPLPATTPIAGEIGFSIGGVYTSLSGWTGERSKSSVGTVQLALLGRWLQRRGYVFWSLGHCYSPEMDYKRQLGHRIYTRAEFRQLLRRHRGPLKIGSDKSGGGEDGRSETSRDAGPIADDRHGAEATAAWPPPGLEPLHAGDVVGEGALLGHPRPSVS
jgi:hypothetical protein